MVKSISCDSSQNKKKKYQIKFALKCHLKSDLKHSLSIPPI